MIYCILFMASWIFLCKEKTCTVQKKVPSSLSGTQCYLPYCIIQFILPMFTIAFGGRLQQSGRRIEKCSNKSGNPISKPNIGPVDVLLASKRAHSSKIFSQARNFYISNLLREALLMKQCKCINISNFGPFLC